MVKSNRFRSIFKVERVLDEHIIRPELISIARDRLFIEATNQLILCDQRKCVNGTGECDNSCLEARAFITGKQISELNNENTNVQQNKDTSAT